MRLKLGKINVNKDDMNEKNEGYKINKYGE
jgi:hypothetical protein